jgi:sporulation protein YlmC with PRC-barrel domain
MLHKTTKLRGLHVLASDGDIGHVDDVLVDERTWTVRYFVVDTSNWIGGRSVLIAPSTLTSVDAVNRKLHVALTREAIKSSPSIEAADIDPAETLPTVWIM